MALNTIFLSRFSAIDAFPHFRSLLQTQFGTSLKHLVYVPTASYCLDKQSSRPIGEQRRRARYDAKQKAAILSNAFGTKEFSLLELDAVDINEELVATKVATADVIYVDGGNTFYLQRHVIQSHFWQALERSQFHARGGLYMGASAGAIIAGKSIRTAYWKGWDDPAVAGTDFVWNDEALQGRGLSDYSVFMHYEASQHAALVEEKKVELDHPVHVIADDVALVNFVDNDGPYKFYSDGRKEPFVVA